MDEKRKDEFQRVYDHPSLNGFINQFTFSGVCKNALVTTGGWLRIVLAQNAKGYYTEFILTCPTDKKTAVEYEMGSEYLVTNAVVYFHPSQRIIGFSVDSETQIHRLERAKEACDLGSANAEQVFEKFI